MKWRAAVLFGITACGGAPQPVASPAAARTLTPVAAPPRALDEATFCRIVDGALDRVVAGLQAAAARPDLTPGEAQAALSRSVPTHAQDDYLAAIRSEGVDPADVPGWVAAHAEAAGRCSATTETRMNDAKPAAARLIKLIADAHEASSRANAVPLRADVHAALAEAKAAGRPAAILFDAAWDRAGQAMRSDLADPRVVALLGAGLVIAEVDCTDYESPTVMVAREIRHVGGLPTLIAFDASGREVGRLTENRGPDAVVHLLESARNAARTP